MGMSQRRHPKHRQHIAFAARRKWTENSPSVLIPVLYLAKPRLSAGEVARHAHARASIARVLRSKAGSDYRAILRSVVEMAMPILEGTLYVPRLRAPPLKLGRNMLSIPLLERSVY